jgi:hypothetical protein
MVVAVEALVLLRLEHSELQVLVVAQVAQVQVGQGESPLPLSLEQ